MPQFLASLFAFSPSKPSPAIQAEHNPDAPRHLFRARLYHLFRPLSKGNEAVAPARSAPVQGGDQMPTFCPPIAEGVLVRRLPARVHEEDDHVCRGKKLLKGQRREAKMRRICNRKDGFAALGIGGHEAVYGQRIKGDGEISRERDDRVQDDGFEECVVVGAGGGENRNCSHGEVEEKEEDDNDDMSKDDRRMLKDSSIANPSTDTLED